LSTDICTIIYKQNEIMQKKLILTTIIIVVFTFFTKNAQAQYLMDMIDTTKNMGQDMLSVVKKFNHVRISGYIQPQFQVAQSKGSKSFNGGDFAATVDNRFMLRRGRIRFDYASFSDHKTPRLQFVFQFDGTERGVNIRDFWGRVFENKYDCFNFTMGMFARPFGNEINLSSGDRESPERGRMSQILMKTERDMGAMVSFAPQKKDDRLKKLQIDLGIFNGQGLASTADYDSYKDIIGRIQWKNQPLSKNVSLNLGASYLNGGIRQNNKAIYSMNKNALDFSALTDSLNIGSRAPRTYIGADAQLKIKNSIGNTELRAEFIKGTQTATNLSSETPATAISDPLYSRPFNGTYLYLLQNIGKKHQFGIKYDWYDANTNVKGTDIKKDTKLSAADIKYNTLGLGYIYYMNENLKWVIWYDIVKNEKTQLTGITEDLKDNIFTFRMQYRF
jgi:hypothetical protein